MIVNNNLFGKECVTGRGTYISEKLLKFADLRMEIAEPTRLDEFCKLHNIDFFNLRMPCIFCKFLCTLEDLASFHQKNLSVVYRLGTPHACCKKCLLHSAKYERHRFFQCTVKCSIIDVVAGKPLDELLVRCLHCFALLDHAEKYDCLSRDEQVVLVRGHWRLCCRNCAFTHDERE